MSLLAHRSDGEGAPVLLLNGGMMTIASWGAFAEGLSARWRVIRCDLRGQLLTPGAPPAALEGHLPDLVALLRALDASPAHLIGTSYGAELALRLAADRPDAVRSVVAVAAVDRFPSETLAGAEREARACREAAAGGDRGRVYDLIVETTYAPAWAAANRDALAARRSQVAALPAAWFSGVAGILESLRGIDLTPVLGAIRCPVLVIAAGDDRIMPLERTRALAGGIRGARLEVVAGAGHGVVLERSGELLALCRAFLEGA